MTRDEFKAKLNGFIDNLVGEDRELTETDENNLTDQFGEVATDMLEDDGDEGGE